MSKLSLFLITESIRELSETLEENGGELTPELEQALTIGQADLEIKVNNYCGFLSEIESQIQAAKKEIERLNAFVKVKQAIASKLQFSLLNATIRLGKQDKEVFRLDVGTRRLSTKISEAVIIEDESKLPQAYFVEKVESSPSKTLIKNALKLGVEIPGASIETRHNLVIK